jgi:hypothetical protein
MKKYIVRLTDEERAICAATIKKGLTRFRIPTNRCAHGGLAGNDAVCGTPYCESPP